MTICPNRLMKNYLFKGPNDTNMCMEACKNRIYMYLVRKWLDTQCKTFDYLSI